MRLDQRKEHILDFIVRDFIRTAVPVSSGRINGKKGGGGGLAASPATIRNIMLELDEDGYLYQPHTSAGRAPTGKGYRYFIENLMAIESPPSEIRKDLDGILDDFWDESESVFDEFARVLARHLKLFSGVGLLDEERIFGHGLPEVLREPEFEEHNLAAEFADFAENAESALRDLKSDFENEEFRPQIDIKRFSSVSVAFNDQEFGRCVMFSFGPKRMNYERASSTLKYAARDIKKRKSKKYG